MSASIAWGGVGGSALYASIHFRSFTLSCSRVFFLPYERIKVGGSALCASIPFRSFSLLCLFLVLMRADLAISGVGSRIINKLISYCNHRLMSRKDKIDYGAQNK